MKISPKEKKRTDNGSGFLMLNSTGTMTPSPHLTMMYGNKTVVGIDNAKGRALHAAAVNGLYSRTQVISNVYANAFLSLF